jgi:ketosteroid isomerase-like protein
MALPPLRTEVVAMAHPNEDLVGRAYDAFSRGDVETLRQLFADEWRGTRPLTSSTWRSQ